MVVATRNDYQAINTANLINRHGANAASSVAKLSSNLRINTGADDPAGIVTAAKLRGRAGSTDAAAQNAQNAATMAKTADSAYSNTLDILYRMREIATEAASLDVNNGGDASGLKEEVNVLNQRLEDIVNNTKFGTQKIFGTFAYYLGTDASSSYNLTFTAPNGSLDISANLTAASACAVINSIDGKISAVAQALGKAGGIANALGYIADGLNTDSSNMWDAYQTFTETNVAKEMSSYVKNTISSQSAQLILSQYNQNAYSVLNLLR